MQQWISAQLTAVADTPVDFVKRYGADFQLAINLSAKRDTTTNDVRGPTVFKRYKTVDYSVFLPFDAIKHADDGCGCAMRYFIDGVRIVFGKLGIETEKLDARRDEIISHVCSEPLMLKVPWYV